MCREQSVAGFGEQLPDLLPLRVSDLYRDPTAIVEMRRSTLGDGPVWIEAVRSSIKRTARIMEPHFGLQAVDLFTWYIGWV